MADVATEFPDYLRDESRMTGTAESISFPASEAELIEHLSDARARGLAVTTQAARTGITAGAVPRGGHILNLSRMNRILGARRLEGRNAFALTVQPGLVLADLREALKTGGVDTAAWSDSAREAWQALQSSGVTFFPPDPTETSAALGGMAACNASGAQSFHYGATRRYIDRLRVVLADGDVLVLRRGVQCADGGAIRVTTEGGRPIEAELPDYELPSVKNAAGYYVHPDMDLVDLFIGAEGTLGIITELDVVLIPAPAVQWGVAVFVPSEAAALQLVRAQRAIGVDIRPVAIEFFNHDALDLLRRQKQENPAFGELPELKSDWHTALYLEYHGADEESVEQAVMAMTEQLVAAGGDEDATWLAADEREMQRLKAFRHAVPEAVNLLIDERRRGDPALTKLGTDLAVPDEALDTVMDLYREGLDAAGLESVVFGHIGNNHVHVNIIPRDREEYARGKALYLEWAQTVVKLGGTVSAEHGIGKLKIAMLQVMAGDDGIRQMRSLKRVFDPEGMLNPGNLFECIGNPEDGHP